MRTIHALTWPTLLLTLAVLSGCQDDRPDDVTNPARAEKIPRIMPVSEVLTGAHIPTLDLAKLNDAEIRKALGTGARCEFKYSSYSEPVLAISASEDAAQTAAVIKLNDKLVVLHRDPAGGANVLRAEDVRINMKMLGEAPESAGDPADAELVFEVGESLRAGYRGYYRCQGESSVQGSASKQ